MGRKRVGSCRFSRVWPGAGKPTLTHLTGCFQNQNESITFLRSLSTTGPKILPFLPVSCLLHCIPAAWEFMHPNFSNRNYEQPVLFAEKPYPPAWSKDESQTRRSQGVAGTPFEYPTACPKQRSMPEDAPTPLQSRQTPGSHKGSRACLSKPDSRSKSYEIPA